MLGAARWSLVPAVVAACLFLPATAHAIVPQVRDGGNYFTAETLKKANDLLVRIQDKHKKDVVVETFEDIPDKVLKRFTYDPKDRKAFFHLWAQDIAKENKVNGIVILIAKDQKHNNTTWIEEEVGDHTRQKLFNSTDRSDLHNIFANKWEKDRNGALLEGLHFIDTRMAFHHSATTVGSKAPTSSSDSSRGGGIWGWICIGLCVFLGIWLVVGLVRAFSGGGANAGGAAGPGYGFGGGGGFFSGLLGGLFGAMAGNWLYHNMFGGHQSWGASTAYGAEKGPGSTDDVGPSDEGQGFAGGGGDVDGGGGDVDAGGGDWGGGGGDWGGGGGDWGGGGGDW